jgi:uncharacterized protein YecT (DUF1311 family)
MQFQRYWLIIFALIAPMALMAQTETTHPIDSALSSCLDIHETTLGMVECFATAQEQWDAELNRAYNELMKLLDTSSKENLRRSQREWIQFRDQEMEFMNNWYGRMDGTLWKIVAAERKAEFVKRRALALQSYIDSIDMEK